MPTAVLHEAERLRRTQRWFLLQLTSVTAGGFFIDGYVLGGIGAAMPSIEQDLHVTPLWSGLLGAATLIGILLGSIAAGWLTDRVGRKPMFLADLAAFVLVSTVQFFVIDVPQLFVIRLIMGIAVGADYAIASPLLAEFSPARIRGRLLSTMEVGWYSGFILAYALGYLLRGQDAGAWHWILASSAVPAALCLAGRHGVPESARWLISRGRRSEAFQILRRYHLNTDDYADIDNEQVADSRFRKLFHRHNLRATVFASSFWTAIVLPYFAIFTFAPKVLSALGLANPLAGCLAVNGLALAGSLTGMMLVDRIGRRLLLLSTLWTTTIALSVVGLWAHAPIGVIVACFVVFAFFNAAAGVLAGIYPQEVFPTDIRTSGTGFACGISRIGAAAGTFLLPLGITHLGTAPTILTGALVLAAGSLVSQLWAPETNGLDLTHTIQTTSGQRSPKRPTPAGSLLNL